MSAAAESLSDLDVPDVSEMPHTTENPQASEQTASCIEHSNSLLTISLGVSPSCSSSEEPSEDGSSVSEFDSEPEYPTLSWL